MRLAFLFGYPCSWALCRFRPLRLLPRHTGTATCTTRLRAHPDTAVALARASSAAQTSEICSKFTRSVAELSLAHRRWSARPPAARPRAAFREGPCLRPGVCASRVRATVVIIVVSLNIYERICVDATRRLGEAGAVGRAMGGPVCAMALTFCASSLGWRPDAAAVASARDVAVLLATPLLLVTADARAVSRECGPRSEYMGAFALGALGTAASAYLTARFLLGTTLAAKLPGGAVPRARASLHSALCPL